MNNVPKIMNNADNSNNGETKTISPFANSTIEWAAFIIANRIPIAISIIPSIPKKCNGLAPYDDQNLI